MQIIEQTHDQKVAMYSKCTKAELIAMLIEANRQISMRTAVPYYPQLWDNVTLPIRGELSDHTVTYSNGFYR